MFALRWNSVVNQKGAQILEERNRYKDKVN